MKIVIRIKNETLENITKVLFFYYNLSIYVEKCL